MKKKIKPLINGIESTKFKIIAVIFILNTLYTILNTPAHAINMNSNQFKIQFGNINIGAKDESSTNYALGVSLGQDAAGKFSSTGYIVKAGFQYIHSIIPFTFSISNTTIGFGSVTPSSFYTGSTHLKVSFGAAGEYQVTARAEDKMKTVGGNTIDFTACDAGTCTATAAQTWTSTSVYGLGYNMSCSGITSTSVRCTPDLPTDFLSTSYFRPFANHATGDTPAVVMSNTNVTSETPEDPSITNDHETNMTMKLNVSPLQAAGSYSSIINFVATPSY
jgi:hypothetical protein